MTLPPPYRILSFIGLWFGFATVSIAQPHQPTQDWPRFLGPNFDGNAVATPKDIDWTSPPTFQWSIEVGPGYGLGSVAGGRYYHFDGAETPRRQDQLERLTAFDLETGAKIWSVTDPLQYRDLLGYEEGSRSTPTVAGDQIFTFGVAGRLNCRNREDGKRIWSVDTNERYGVVQNFFGVGSSPLILDDVVIVMVGGSPAADQDVAPMRLNRVSPNGSALVALDRRDGTEVWRCGDDLASYSSPRTISLGGKTFVLALARNGLLLIDPVAGKVQWRMDYRAEIVESVNAMVPIVHDDQIFISECYQVGSVLIQATSDSYQTIWSDPVPNRRLQSMRSHWATPVLVDGFLYGCSGRNGPDSDLRCIDWATGEVKWKDARRIRSSITRSGDHLIVLEERGDAQVIGATPTGLEVIADWPLSQPDGDRPALRYPCWAAPIAVGDRVILRGDDQVICLRLARTAQPR
ncbi:outer membrane biogenesis protein BamB [Rubripirellula lacrimiformis]|uniref:Outer membrane biogenesis protein BamB n=1 Tax=Rubripirellula lacrimiformis TaxID=1930273 RepID=A0A517NJB2_9BACT|nr:PQQ-binding-like beta-propeller repeat protein [Rubripirellula lacrimiformis]QDT07219.1 outer membrane biogenesis protein BamB [Rubripirellula lacrimiformis]